MSSLIKTKGIVLHVMPIKEHDKRIIVFSKEYGKMVVFANGAKRSKSPLLAGTQPFVFGEFTVLEGRNSFTLRSVEIEESFYSLRQDMISLSYGLYLLEVTGSVIQEMDPNEELLRLLYISLLALKLEYQDGKTVKSVFEFRCLSTLGFAPDLTGCMECKEKESGFFLSVKGGLICKKCHRIDQEISDEALHVLRYIQASPLKKIYHFHIKETLFQEIEPMIESYFKHFVPNDFRSLDIIKYDE